jgi:hypothetical protein
MSSGRLLTADNDDNDTKWKELALGFENVGVVDHMLRACVRGRASGLLDPGYEQGGGSWDSGEEGGCLTIGCQSDVRG